MVNTGETTKGSVSGRIGGSKRNRTYRQREKERKHLNNFPNKPNHFQFLEYLYELNEEPSTSDAVTESTPNK